MKIPKILQNQKFCLLALIVAGILLFSATFYTFYDIIDTRRVDAEAVTLKTDFTAEFGELKHVSDFIENLNGEYLDDPVINTEVVGEQTLTYTFKNFKNKIRTRELKIIVVDTTKPIIYGADSYTVPQNYDGDLTSLMLSGDNADDHPTREIIGEYDLNKIGTYKLEYVITDESGNEARKKFTLNVVRPSVAKPAYQEVAKTPIVGIIKTHKTNQTKIGIDVSGWQGEIDWSEVKKAGVEFAFIRVGYQISFGGELYLDKYFKTNLENATKAGIPLGVYFYSCATSPAEAAAQANWVIEQIGDTKIELGIAFDWEEWSNFNNAGISFHTLNKTAEKFITTAEENGYKGLLYGSKTYLDRFWTVENGLIWLAQYYDYPTYTGTFHFWQLSNTGKVAGINGDVDLDIMYLENFIQNPPEN